LTLPSILDHGANVSAKFVVDALARSMNFIDSRINFIPL
jgi:hypothetical protein